MKKKVAVLGNSHVGAIKMAWNSVKHHAPNLDLTYFASPGTDLEYLKIQGTKLVPVKEKTKNSIVFTSEGLDCVNTQDFDAFLLYAMGAQPYLPDLRYFYSEEAYRAAIRNRRVTRTMGKVLMLVRKISDKAIFVGENPLISSSKAESRDFTNTEKKLEGESVYIAGASLSQRLFYEDYGATLVYQPNETITDGRWTKEEFCKNSKKLDIGEEPHPIPHGKNDINHMNEQYGKLWLKAFLRKVKNLEEYGRF